MAKAGWVMHQLSKHARTDERADTNPLQLQASHDWVERSGLYDCDNNARNARNTRIHGRTPNKVAHHQQQSPRSINKMTSESRCMARVARCLFHGWQDRSRQGMQNFNTQITVPAIHLSIHTWHTHPQVRQALSNAGRHWRQRMLQRFQKRVLHVDSSALHVVLGPGTVDGVAKR